MYLLPTTQHFSVSLVLLLIASLAPRSVNSSYLEFGPAVNRYSVGELPDVNFNLPASWAGQIPVPTTNNSNDELFFWLFEAETQVPSANLISRNSVITNLLLRADNQYQYG